MDAQPTYWRSRFLTERALALLYLIGFLVAANQFVPLLGEGGFLPVREFVGQVPFRFSPSVFYAAPTDAAFRIAAWTGALLACIAFSPYPARSARTTAALWAAMWALYLSFVNVGQTFYAFGWETLLLEAGFLAIFFGHARAEPNRILNWLWRWLAFRVMLGAGLIKLRGDPCWRDLTCLDYYFETQPMPNALSWYFHWLPSSVHHAGVAINHVVEIVIPFGLFAPQPMAALAAFAIIGFQLMLIVSGNLSWLNWLTIVIAIPAIHDRWLPLASISPRERLPPAAAHRLAAYVLAAVVALLSVAPTLNLLSPRQMMNTSFEPLHLVNTYGAFGSITRLRHEIVLEGTDEEVLSATTKWKEYEFKGKPGDTARRPPQIAPYHLRLDWLMWFAAMDTPDAYPWLGVLTARLLEGDPATLSLLRANPFAGRPPKFIRGHYYEYRFTTPAERQQTGAWWVRESRGLYFPSRRAADQRLSDFLPLLEETCPPRNDHVCSQAAQKNICSPSCS
jgi:hypothetical protein